MPNNNPQQTTPQQQIARAAEGASKTAARLGESAEHATSAAIEKVRQVRDEAQSGIEHQRTEISGRIRRLGAVLRAGSETLGVDDPLAQQLFSSAGDRIEQVAEYIGNITPGELVDDVTTLARRRPGLFFGGTFILGLALGRFVKSSASAASGGFAEQSEEYEEDARPVTRRSQSRPGPAQPARRQVSTGAAASSAAAPSAPSGASSPSASPGASSYGSASSPTAGTTPVQSSSSTPASGTARDVERGEGSKS